MKHITVPQALKNIIDLTREIAGMANNVIPHSLEDKDQAVLKRSSFIRHLQQIKVDDHYIPDAWAEGMELAELDKLTLYN